MAIDKRNLILKYFQKKDLLRVENKEYQETISFLFKWLTKNDKVNHDVTSRLFPDYPCTAQIIACEEGMAAGLEEVAFLLGNFTSLSFYPLIQDGHLFKKGENIAQIHGQSHQILAYERTILNILQRMSGIATKTFRLINLISQPPYLAATRKTPWMTLDKKAVSVGGGLTHRLNLADGILIKDNHLVSLSIEDALINIFKKKKNTLIEIEVETEKQAKSAIMAYQNFLARNLSPLTHHRFALLLDNFHPSQAKALLKKLSKEDVSKIIFEASGGINEKNLQEWAKTGVDLLSLGFLTHSVFSTNFSLEITSFPRSLRHT